METRILTLFTRTPLHIGAGSSVGAVDLPVVRERHTRFPVIPGTSLKGVLADLWEPLQEQNGTGLKLKRDDQAVWLFGAEDAKAASAGALLIGDARLLAFPVRSARNAFAWITSPLAVARFARDVGQPGLLPPTVADGECIAVGDVVVEGTGKVVLEEYAYSAKADGGLLSQLATSFAALLPGDAVWAEVSKHLVIVSDGVLSFFAENACEIATHVRIDDATGTAAPGALFNQENVPSECLFYSVLSAQAGKGAARGRTAKEALDTLAGRLQAGLIQLGADETTGLGWCNLSLKEV
jgi:CRISPR-associated protein Cmr4